MPVPADMPDGKVWTDELHEAYNKARDETKASNSDLINFYPPGSAKIMQWTLTRPVPLSGHRQLVTASVPFKA